MRQLPPRPTKKLPHWHTQYKDNKQCTFPWTAMVIDPSGNLNECCGILDKQLNGVNTRDKLDFKAEHETGLFARLREQHEKHGWRNLKQCKNCKLSADAGRGALVNTSRGNGEIEIKEEDGLQQLEFSTSNACNQQCVMCSSYFSSQWKTDEHRFDREVQNPYVMTKHDQDEIIKLLPGLKRIILKGGEPFQAIRNIKILNELFKVNDTCIVSIVTNMAEIPRAFKKILSEHPDRFSISASIDAIGERYHWIRGTPWEQTLENLKWCYENMGHKTVGLCPTFSVYNIRHYNELVNWSWDCPYVQDRTGGIIRQTHSNFVQWPHWCSPYTVMTQDQLDDAGFFFLESRYNESSYQDYLKYTKVMNDIRGFSVSQLGID